MSGLSSAQLRPGWQALNRVYIGQISSINTKRGTASVVIFDGLGTTRLNLELPWGGFSMNGHKSSWVRYMPQLRSRPTSDTDHPGGDLVYVAFGPRGEARIVGYATIPGMYEGFVKAKTTNGSAVPRGDFADLRQGEWDMRSSGGAYIFGSRDGMLLLAAGPTVQARFDKPNNEARCEAGLWKVGGTGSFIKLGDVKRLLPGSFKEKDLSSLDTTAPKEFYVHLETPVLGGAALPIADLEFGAVRSSLGAPVLGIVGTTPGFLRERKRVYAVGGATTVFTSELDVLGNHYVQYGEPTTKVQVDGGPVTDLEANFLNVEINTTESVDVNAVKDINLTAVGGVNTKSTLSTSLKATVNATLEADVNALVKAGAAATLQAGGVATVSGATLALTGTSAATLDAVAVRLGAAASSPAVHGTQALTLFQGIVASLYALGQAMAPLEGVSLGMPKGIAWQGFATAMLVLQQGVLAQPPGPSGLLSAKVTVE